MLQLLPNCGPELWVKVVERSADGQQHVAHLSVAAFVCHVRQAGHGTLAALLVDGLECLAHEDTNREDFGCIDGFSEVPALDQIVKALRFGGVVHRFFGGAVAQVAEHS